MTKSVAKKKLIIVMDYKFWEYKDEELLTDIANNYITASQTQ